MAGAGVVSPITVVRPVQARRVRLALDPRTGEARLVVPRRASLREALRWAEGQADWLAKQRAALPETRPFADGAVLPVADEALTIRWRADHGRAVVREGDALVTGGPAETVPRRIEAWLRRAALDLLSRETAEFAAKAGVSVTGVAVGDPRARWGSCSASGDIRYSWRLLLAPGHVRRATVAHEVAHRLHMHHGPAFHAAAAAVLGADPAPARAWLKRHGAGLHWYGRQPAAQ